MPDRHRCDDDLPETPEHRILEMARLFDDRDVLVAELASRRDGFELLTRHWDSVSGGSGLCA